MVTLPFESLVNYVFDVFANWFIYFVKIFILLFPIYCIISIIIFGIRFIIKNFKINSSNNNDN